MTPDWGMADEEKENALHRAQHSLRTAMIPRRSGEAEKNS
jgi:hypothetical protein